MFNVAQLQCLTHTGQQEEQIESHLPLPEGEQVIFVGIKRSENQEEGYIRSNV